MGKFTITFSHSVNDKKVVASKEFDSQQDADAWISNKNITIISYPGYQNTSSFSERFKKFYGNNVDNPAQEKVLKYLLIQNKDTTKYDPEKIKSATLVELTNKSKNLSPEEIKSIAAKVIDRVKALEISLKSSSLTEYKNLHEHKSNI